MSQEELEEIKEELKRLEESITDQELKLAEAAKQNMPERLITICKERRDRLIEEEKVLRQDKSALQALLASAPGDTASLPCAHL